MNCERIQQHVLLQDVQSDETNQTVMQFNKNMKYNPLHYILETLLLLLIFDLTWEIIHHPILFRDTWGRGLPYIGRHLVPVNNPSPPFSLRLYTQ